MVDIEKNEVGNGDISKKYDVVQLIGIAFNSVNKNIGAVGKFLLKAMLATIIPTIITILMFVVFEDRLVSIEDQLETGLVMQAGITITLIILFILLMGLLLGSVINWMMYKTIVNMNTGIESIDSKKVDAPKDKSYSRILGVQSVVCIIATLIGLSMVFSIVTPVLFMWLMPQVVVAMIILNMYTNFAYFEVLAKNKSVSEALTNARIKLFFSKDRAILNLFLGNVLLWVGTLLFTYAVQFGMMFVVTLGAAIPSVFVNSIIMIISFAVTMVVALYPTFITAKFNYLAYILTEVRDDKVDKLR